MIKTQSVTISRIEFLSALEAVEGALTTGGDTVSQSSCLVFRGGRAFAFDNELLCRTKSRLPKIWSGAVRGRQLIDSIRNIPDAEVEVSVGEKFFVVKGRRDRVRVLIDPSVQLPIDKVEPPGETWTPLAADFADAMKGAAECAKKEDESSFALTCIRLHPKYIEGTDGFAFCRVRGPTGVSAPCLVRRQWATKVAQRTPTSVNETKEWLHFCNGTGLVMSVRKYTDGIESYPNMTPFCKIKGVPTPFPRTIKEAALRAELFSKEYDSLNELEVSLANGRLTLTGVGITGDYRHTTRVKYGGPDVTFVCGPTTLANIVEKYGDIELAEDIISGEKGQTLMVVRQSGFLLVVCLRPSRNGEKSDAE